MWAATILYPSSKHTALVKNSHQYALQQKVTLGLPLVFREVQPAIIPPIFAEDRERPVAGRYYLSSEGGVSFTIGGGSSEFINRMKSSVSQTIAGISITATLSNDSFDFDDVFKTPKVFGLSLGYGVTDSTELFSRIQSTLADAEPFDIAKFTVSARYRCII